MNEQATNALAVPLSKEEAIYAASQWQLIRAKFLKHRLAVLGIIVVILYYLVAMFGGFLAPYGPNERHTDYVYAPPQRIYFDGVRPVVYGITQTEDPNSFRRIYSEDRTRFYYLRFFTQGPRYKILGLIPSNVHLFGVEEGVVFLFGTDKLGRDLFTRNIYSSSISLSIGLVGVTLSFVLGCVIGGISGFYGGVIDNIIQRFIEFLRSVPTIPLWMALSAALPPQWPPLRVYFGITIILSLVGWSGLARIVRGKLLELREEDFVMAARLAGASDGRLIVRHMLPGFMSYLIVDITFSIPDMIIGETALSFLGLGLRPPVVSWGVLLQDAQNIRTITQQPWLLIPALFIIVMVLMFNFVGDGLRDAADPYKSV
jgi:peptide/nickel transport system permease protein